MLDSSLYLPVVDRMETGHLGGQLGGQQRDFGPEMPDQRRAPGGGGENGEGRGGGKGTAAHSRPVSMWFESCLQSGFGPAKAMQWTGRGAIDHPNNQCNRRRDGWRRALTPRPCQVCRPPPGARRPAAANGTPHDGERSQRMAASEANGTPHDGERSQRPTYDSTVKEAAAGGGGWMKAV